MPSNDEQHWYTVEPPDSREPFLVLASSTSLAESGRAEELNEINEQLKSVGWVLRRESASGDATAPVVTPLLLAPLDPLNVGPVSTPQAALRALPRDLRVGGFLDDLVLDGFPAHKGGALTRGDFNRVPVAVLTSAP